MNKNAQIISAIAGIEILVLLAVFFHTALWLNSLYTNLNVAQGNAFLAQDMAFIFLAVLSVGSFLFCYYLLKQSKKNIFVKDGNIIALIFLLFPYILIPILFMAIITPLYNLIGNLH